MPIPIIDKLHPPEFEHDQGKGLHKKKYVKKNKATITGTYISVGDDVVVSGTKGKKSVTIWSGKVFKDNGDGTYVCKDLDVIQQQQDMSKRFKSGTEDVSTTVTNPATGTSNPVTTPMVVVIP